VLQQLKVNAGSEFIASVNAGLKRNIPFTSLDKPRRVFAALLATESSETRLTRAIHSIRCTRMPAFSCGASEVLRSYATCARREKLGLTIRVPAGPARN
jgi:hypothetical protein